MTRWRLFAGKGGVGKTTCAAAFAIDAAELGARVLLISTDPAHSLGDALEVELGPAPRRVPVRRGALWACELDAPLALTRWLEERSPALLAVAERGTLLQRSEAEELLRLSLPGADELVGLLEVERLAREGGHQVVVVDTAPTGHTLRLLDAPGTLARLARAFEGLLAKDRWMAARFGRGRRGDPAERLVDELEGRASELAGLLRDPDRCQVAWVVLPEELPVAETTDGLRALEALGVAVPDVVLNRLTPVSQCPGCSPRAREERRSLRGLLPHLRGRDLRVVPALPHEPRGIRALRAVARRMRAPAGPLGRAGSAPRPARGGPPAAPPWAQALLAPPRRLVLFGGKGGVGKTTCAATAALAAVALGREALLLSLDPAHSTADVLGMEPCPDDGSPREVAGTRGRLRLRELDARAVFARARGRWQAALDELFQAFTGAGLDATFDREAARELIELAPPGLDELLGALEVIEELLGGGSDGAGLLVVDLPPTGHALRLLESPELALAWVRTSLRLLRDQGARGSLARDLTVIAGRLRRLQELLRDPERTGFVVVTRSGELPMRETRRLMSELSRRGVPLAAVVANGLVPDAGRCRWCRAAAAGDAAALAALLREGPASRSWAMIRASRAAPLRGPAALGAWGLSWRLDEQVRQRGSGPGRVEPRRAPSTSTASSPPRPRPRGADGRRGSKGSRPPGRRR